MTLGPEFVRGLRAALSGRLPWRIHKAEGGDSWVALKLGHDDLWLLFSWGSGTGGCCLADGGSVSALRKGASARTPLVEVLWSRFVKGDPAKTCRAWSGVIGRANSACTVMV